MTQGAGSGHGVLECWLFFFLNRTRRRGARKHRACIARGQSSMTASPRHTGTSSAQNTGERVVPYTCNCSSEGPATEDFDLVARDGPWQHHTSSPSGEQTFLGDFEGHLDDLKATRSPGPLKNADAQHHLLTVGKQGGRWASHHVRRTCILSP